MFRPSPGGKAAPKRKLLAKPSRVPDKATKVKNLEPKPSLVGDDISSDSADGRNNAASSSTTRPKFTATKPKQVPRQNIVKPPPPRATLGLRPKPSFDDFADPFGGASARQSSSRPKTFAVSGSASASSKQPTRNISRNVTGGSVTGASSSATRFQRPSSKLPSSKADASASAASATTKLPTATKQVSDGAAKFSIPSPKNISTCKKPPEYGPRAVEKSDVKVRQQN